MFLTEEKSIGDDAKERRENTMKAKRIITFLLVMTLFFTILAPTSYAMPSYSAHVTYDANGADSGSVPIDNNDYGWNSTVTVLGNTGGLQKAGYTFEGWKRLTMSGWETLDPGDTFKIKFDTTLHAVWEESITSYTLEIDMEGNGSGSVTKSPNQASYTDGAVVTLNAAADPGSTFDGFYTTRSGSSSTGYTYSGKLNPAQVTMDSDKTIYAVFYVDSTHTVYYHKNDGLGSAPSDEEYDEGDTVTVAGPGGLSKYHYEFIGWNTESNGNGDWYYENDTFLMGTHDVDLYAQWGYLYDHIDVKLDGTLTIEHQIDGVTQSSTTLNVTVSHPSANVAGPDSFSLSESDFHLDSANNEFRATGLSFLWPDTVTVNATLTDQNNIEYHIQHTFGQNEILAAWNLCPGTEWGYTKGFDFVITALDVENQITNTVTYKTTAGGTIDGGTDDIVHTGILDGGDCPTPPVTSANSGYNFLGWTKNGGSTYYTSLEVDAMTINADTTFTAVYELDQTFTVHNQCAPGNDHGYFTVTYDGTTSLDHLKAHDDLVLDYVSGVDTITVTFYADSGYVFIRDTNIYAPPTPSNPETRDISPGQTTNVHPQWGVGYSVTYDENDATSGLAPTDSDSYAEGQEVTVLGNTGSLEKSGYSFKGWNTQSNGNGDHYDANDTFDMPSNNVTLYAEWGDPVEYTITYNMHGGTNDPANPDTYTVEDTPITLEDPTRAGYGFVEWTPSDNIPAGSTGNKTFDAVWTMTPIQYTITYNMHGGTNDPGNPDTYNVESPTITLEDPTRAGYTFEGWTPTDTIPTGSTGNKTFDATWSDPIEYDITYIMNGGTNDPDNPDTYTVEDTPIVLEDPTRTGYIFVGWTPNDTISEGSTGDKTFTATWSDPIEYDITYVMNGGTNDPGNPDTYTVESPTITLEDPTRAGYTFEGWTPTGTIPAGSTGNKTFTATWSDPIEYDITYVMNGGTNDPGNPDTYTVESPTITLEDPTRAGYTFEGWTPTGTIPAGSTGNKTFTATFSTRSRTICMAARTTPVTRIHIMWNRRQLRSKTRHGRATRSKADTIPSDPIEYDITYVMNGGTNDPGNPDTYTVESPTITLEDPTRAGYTFEGWTPTGTIPAGSTGNKTFTATWSDPIEYDITYVMNGGTNDPGNPDTYTVESPTITLEDPTRAGYTFEGWTPTDTIATGSTGNKTFTATWSDPIEYDITYVMNGGTNDPGNPDTYTIEDTPITLEDPTRAGYTFEGWTPTGTIPAGSTGNKTFTATWSDPIEYDITYVMNGGTNDPGNPDTYTVESPTITLEDPTRAGYTFEGWTPTDTIATGSTGNKTFTATWSDPIEYDITYVMNGGTNDPGNPDTYTIKSPTITLEDPTRAGYTFEGWTPTGTIPAGSTGNKTFTATWSDPIEYDITYVMNGGTNDPGNPDTYTIESPSITLEDPTRAGYTFEGWTPTGTIPAGSTGNKTFTATWSDPIEYDITYVMNGGTNDPGNPDTYTIESPSITLEDPTRAGYTFDGWTPTDTIPSGSTGNKTFTATWSDPIEYDITYVMNGGTNDPGNPDTYNIEDTPITLEDPTRAGYTFDGWTPTDTIPSGSTGNKTFEAAWAPVVYTITYDLDGGNVDGVNPETYTVESADITLINPTRAGYTFTGWNGTGIADGTDTVVIPTGSTGNRSYTATWSILVHTVTFVDYDGTVLGTDRVPHGGDAVAPADPERDGYDFTGWDRGYRNVTSSFTVTAEYSAIRYTVIFVDHDGTELGRDIVEYGENATPPADPEREGYTFVGWTPSYTNITGDLTVTAMYEPIALTVTFIDHDGTVLEEQAVDYGGTADAPDDPDRDGYAFDGWDKAFDNVTEDLVVTALYTELEDVPEEPVPEAGSSVSWLWWLLLLLLIPILFLLIYRNVIITYYDKDGDEDKQRKRRSLRKRGDDDEPFDIELKDVKEGTYKADILIKSGLAKKIGKKTERTVNVKLNGSVLTSGEVPADTDDRFEMNDINI